MSKVYWEKQGQDKLCAVHCLNSLLQGPVFTVGDLARAAQKLDDQEAAVLGGKREAESQNVDASGNFSIQVMNAVLADKNFSPVSYERPDVRAQVMADPTKMDGYICNSHRRAHWFAMRRIGNQWFDLDSLKHAPKLISDFQVALFIESTLQDGFSLFVLQGRALPEPLPHAYGPPARHQFWLNGAQIADLARQGGEDEKREMDNAQRVADGGGTNDDGDGPPKSYLQNPREQPKTDWSKMTGGGRSLGGGPPAQAAPVEMDADLAAAIAMSIAGAKDSVEPPLDEPAEGIAACTIQARLPNGQKIQRKFPLDGGFRQILVWIEHATVSDPALGTNLLGSNYSLVYGYPRVKAECKGGVVKVGGEDKSAQSLTDAKFGTKEQVMVQLG